VFECVSEHTLVGDVVPVDAASHRVSCGSRQEIHQNRVRIRVGEARAFGGRRAVPNRPSRPFVGVRGEPSAAPACAELANGPHGMLIKWSAGNVSPTLTHRKFEQSQLRR
jgi:hypothetical protein